VGNLGSRDRTLEICERHGARIIDLGKKQGRDEARNQLLGDDWNLWLHPWEILLRGADAIREPKKRGAFYIQVFQGGVITKEIRYWNGDYRFENPVYESLQADNAQELLGPTIFAGESPDTREESLQLVNEWLEREPASNDPYYYLAFAQLSLRNYQAFINTASEYLVRDSKSQSAIMLRYYLAQVQLHVYADTKQSFRNIMACITAHPVMSEFWCLLADILYRQKKYEKAQAFYENAMILGRKRSNFDHWPIEIAKYQEYPESMLGNIAQMSEQAKLFEAVATK
jgi:tetratricopeptide (TPR) repeat protein